MKAELDAIIFRAGREPFAEACRIARRTAPGTGRMTADDAAGIPRPQADEMPGFVYDLPYWIINEMKLAPLDRVALVFALYERMPSYSVLGNAGPAIYADGCPDALALYQRNCQRMLGDDSDALADPVGYSLWCGPFEDVNEVESWWRELTRFDGPTRLFERLLPLSGPVPFPLKAELYERLFPDERWHPFIRLSLEGSLGDICGDYDIEAATHWYHRLGLFTEPDDAPSL